MGKGGVPAEGVGCSKAVEHTHLYYGLTKYNGSKANPPQNEVSLMPFRGRFEVVVKRANTLSTESKAVMKSKQAKCLALCAKTDHLGK